MPQNQPFHSTKPLIVILGPTANGKTRLAVAMAEKFNGEIISVDSRQVFRHMDIGTGKDLAEYGSVPHHLIDINEPGEEYNLFSFAEDFVSAFSDISDRDRLPIAAGGTGLYLDALIARYDLAKAEINPAQRAKLEALTHAELKATLIDITKSQHNQTDLEEKARTIRAIEVALAQRDQKQRIQWPEYSTLVIGLQFPRETTRERIAKRLKHRLENGMIEEVQHLLKMGISHQQLEHYGLEYRYISKYLRGEFSLNDMHQKLRSAICQFAKQQEKWFRNIEAKRNQKIHWLDVDASPEMQAENLIVEFLREQACSSED
jgi:tRNA dimethylallyltransferase